MKVRLHFILHVLNCYQSLQHYSTLKKELEILEFAKDAGDSLPKESEEDVRQKEEVLMSLKKAAISLKGMYCNSEKVETLFMY